jgi:Phosphoenolpyruvate carboxylase
VYRTYDTQGDCLIETELREMYVQWPFFREMIDLIAMTLSKTDYSISTNYEKQVRPSVLSGWAVPSATLFWFGAQPSILYLQTIPQLCDPNNKELAAIGVEMRRRLIVTRNNVQRVTGSEDFSNGFQLLKVRDPH